MSDAIDGQQPIASQRRDSRGVVGILVSAAFALSLGATLLAVAFPLLAVQRFGLGAETGLIVAVRLIPNVVMGAFIGRLIDKLPTREVAALSAVADAVAIALMPFTSGAVGLISLSIVSGIATMFGLPAILALRAQSVSDSERFRSTSAIIGGERVGKVVGPLLIVPIQIFATVSAAFWLASTLFLATGLAFMLVPRPKPSATEASDEEETIGGWRRLASVFLEASEPLRNRVVAMMTLTTMSYTMATGLGAVLLIALSSTVYRETPGALGYLLAAQGLGGVAGAFGARLVEKWDALKLFVIATILEAVVWSVLGVGIALAALIGALVVAGLLESIGTVAVFARVQELVPAARAGSYFATVLPLVDATYAIGLALGGILIVGASAATSAIIVGLVMAVPIIVGAVWVRADLHAVDAR